MKKLSKPIKSKPLTHAEVSSRGGKAKWAKISKKKRSELLKKVSLARFPVMSEDSLNNL